MGRALLVSILALLPAAAAAARGAEPPHDALRFAEDVMIPMRDGVRLAADIYRPARGGRPLAERLPVLLQRTPYDKTGRRLVEDAQYFARHGYVVVLQDVRGRYRSEGAFSKYLGEGRDGYDTIEYVAGLPYSDGTVGLWGTSYAEFGPEAALPDFHRELQLRWFDRYLKGEPTPAEPPVQIFVMGTGDGHKDGNERLFHGGYWRSAGAWPLPETEFQRYYFHADGSLRREPPGETSPTTYTFDPRRPVPTIGGAFSSTSPVFEPGAYDQRVSAGVYGSRPPYLPLKARHDVVVFQSDPLGQDVEVIGPITVRLYASSTAADTDFTVKLLDVYPPSRDFPAGFEMNLTDGILRARYRDSPSRPSLLTPGEVYELAIEPFPTANVFKRGHRIRVDVSSSNFPRFDVNPNTGEPLGRSRRMVVADNSIHHDARRPSHVVLPVVPRPRRGPQEERTR